VDGVVAWLLDGPHASYSVTLPGPGEPKRAVLRSYPKEHPAEYLAQAFIDLARRLRDRIPDLGQVERITLRTNRRTHDLIGSGSADPRKYDPLASRETLDHSLPYVFAIALQDGAFHHDASYARERSSRPDTVALWRRIRTVEDPRWTAAFETADSQPAAMGGRAVVELAGGAVLAAEIALADAHPRGAKPFGRENCIAKFYRLTEDVVTASERDRYLERLLVLPKLDPAALAELSIEALPLARTVTKGIF
jgi:2-methylcitrate dehydratase